MSDVRVRWPSFALVVAVLAAVLGAGEWGARPATVAALPYVPSAAMLPADLQAAIAFSVDLDRDGDHDIVALSLSRPAVVLINDGHGRFTRRSSSGRERFVTGQQWEYPFGARTGAFGVPSGQTTVATLRGPLVLAVPDPLAGLWTPPSAPSLRDPAGRHSGSRGPPAPLFV